MNVSDVNSSDVTRAQSVAGQNTNTSNFRSDVNRDGVVDSADVALVQSHLGSALLRVGSVSRSAGGFLVQGDGVPSKAHAIQASENPAEGFSTIGSATADEAGRFSYEDTTSTELPRRFYRVLMP